MAAGNKEIFKTKCNDTYNIDPKRIVVRNDFNCRENFDLDELVASIKENGILNPISVTLTKDEEGNDLYLLVDGERRYRAAMKAIEDGADIKAIRAVILPNLTEAELLEQQVIRNQGKPFNEYEYGKFVHKMMNRGYSITDIAKKLGKNTGSVTYMRQVLDWPIELQEFVKNDNISAAEVRRIKKEYCNGDINLTTKYVSDTMKGAIAKGKKRITSKDLDPKIRLDKDSKAIFTGLERLFKYYKKYANGKNINVSTATIFKELKDGKRIDEILEEAIAIQYKKAE